ncbi:hypothetical protein B0A52_02996 [Exophiala mesophila]|uniref:Uncharacterized protein n=1 Tax=Exophiala mesophila TaxID=212818 RepID=A0A438NCM2_EXOME|nr:hypothetical protein B0A52_02996 [Exophiala mesophila]
MSNPFIPNLAVPVICHLASIASIFHRQCPRPAGHKHSQAAWFGASEEWVEVVKRVLTKRKQHHTTSGIQTASDYDPGLVPMPRPRVPDSTSPRDTPEASQSQEPPLPIEPAMISSC